MSFPQNTFGYTMPLATGVDLRTATVLKARILLPSSTVIEHTLDIETVAEDKKTGLINYPILSGDFAEAGNYSIQIFDLTPGRDIASPEIRFVVDDSIIPPTDAVPPVFGSASVNTAGTILTVTLTEIASPPILPATAITGFLLSGTTATCGLGTASGDVLTIALTGTVKIGQTPTLSYIPGNVTDSATIPNAMLFFSNKAITNNSTAT